MASKKLVEIDPIKLLLEKNRQLEERLAKAEARPVQKTEIKSESDEIIDMDEDGKRFLFQVRGIKGDRGERGERGPQGERGLTGLTGPQGPKGKDGRDGKDGERGLQGPAGRDGKDGKQGKQGKQGPKGLDARDFTAGKTKPSKPSEGDIFLNSDTGELFKFISGKWEKIGDFKIVGPQGPAGPMGPQGPAGGGTGDHGALTGLGDDDHPQYHNDARGDARYYTKAQVDAMIANLNDLVTYTQFGGL